MAFITTEIDGKWETILKKVEGAGEEDERELY